MYKYTITPPTSTVTIWLEFSTFDELPPAQQSKTRPTMAQSMTQRSEIEMGGIAPQTVLYADILTAFPALDPEITYVTTHFESKFAAQWPMIK